MNLSQKYRPKTLEEVIGQQRACALLRHLDGRYGGRAFWLTGASGVGKTTLAHIIAERVADRFFIEELTASELTPRALDEIERVCCLSAWGKGGRVYIVNEAHGLRQDAIRILKDVLERLPDHVTWVFTTTRVESEKLFESPEDAQPFVDRCVSVPLTNQGLSRPFAERAKQIEEAEGLNGKPVEAYVKLAQKCGNSLRAMLAAIENRDMLA